MFVYSYKNYTITQNIITGICYITYPNDKDGSIYTKSLKKAYEFIDKMED